MIAAGGATVAALGINYVFKKDYVEESFLDSAENVGISDELYTAYFVTLFVVKFFVLRK